MQRRKRHLAQKQPYRVTVLELGAKLTVNVFLMAVALSALVKLVPYGISQQAKLQDLHKEVHSTEGRVQALAGDFAYHFDPQQMKSIMEEQSSRVDPTQWRVIFRNSSPTAVTPAQSNGQSN